MAINVDVLGHRDLAPNGGAGVRTEDLSSPGSSMPVPAGAIRQTHVAGTDFADINARQTAGFLRRKGLTAADVLPPGGVQSAQRDWDGGINRPNVADKALKKATKCDHHVRTFKVDGSVLCHECETRWPTQVAYQSEIEELQRSERSNVLAKSAKTADRPDLQPRYLPMSKSSAALSQIPASTNDDPLRDEVAERLYATAAAETDQAKKAVLTKLAQGIDSGRLPIPANFATRVGPVRLSTGQPMHKSAAGPQGERWRRRHGFGG